MPKYMYRLLNRKLGTNFQSKFTKICVTHNYNIGQVKYYFFSAKNF